MSEFKNLPSGWKVVKLGEICNVKQGLQIPISERFCENAQNRYFYITNEFLKEKSEVKYYIENPPESTICFCDDILMTRTGNTGMVVTNVFGVFHNNFFKIAYDRQLIKKEYFVFLLTGPKIQNEILKRAGSSTIPDLNHSDFLSIKIPLPPLDEQEKIAEILSTWDEAINLTINLIENKKQFKKALMQNLLTAKIRFPKFQDEWREVTIGELFEFKKGQGLSKEMLDTNGKFECVLYGELYTTYDEIIENVKSRTNFQGSIKSKFDDILIPSSTTTGSIDIAIAAVILKNDVLLGGDINILRKKRNNIYGKFVAYCITNIKNKELSSYAQGTTIIHLYAKDFKDMKIKLPNLNEQQKIAEVLTACDDEINLLNLKLENLKKQKQGLMQKLLSGKVRVK